MARRLSAIGVHVGDDTIAAAQITRRGALHAWAIIDRVESEFTDHEAARLAGVLDRRGFGGPEVVIGAGEQAAFCAVLEVPDRSTGAPVDEIARSELARLRRVNAQSIACQVVDLPAPARAGQGASVLAFGCAHDQGESLIEPFDRAGLEVVAIDSRVCALARACDSHLAQLGMGAAIHIGGGGSRIVIVHQGMIVYERWFADMGLCALRADIERELRVDRELSEFLVFMHGVDCDGDGLAGDTSHMQAARETIGGWADTLCRECTVALRYAGERYGGAGPELLVLTGPGSRIAGLDRLFLERAGCAAHVWCPGDVLSCCDTADPALAIPVGLAMRFDP